MKKNDALLTEIDIFEKLAVYGDRSYFLKSIAQEIVSEDVHNAKEHKRCNCEQTVCEKSDKHVAGTCKNHAGDKKVEYVGSICNECAKTMPKEYFK